jgi:hypothetical protein
MGFRCFREFLQEADVDPVMLVGRSFPVLRNTVYFAEDST